MALGAAESAESSTYQVRVLDRAIDILDCFNQRQRELSLPEIVELTGLNRSTARRLAANLVRRGLLQEAPATGRYQLGLRLFEMGSVVSASFSLLEAAAGPLSALQEEVGGTIMLAAPSGDHFVIVDRREGTGEDGSMVSMRSEIGTVRPITYGPIGRVFLSTLSLPAVRLLLDKYPLEASTPYSITDVPLLLERLADVAYAGYAMDVNEVTEGIMGLATPIRDLTGETAGVLCLGVPSTRENDASFVETALSSLMATSAAISANMGHGADSGPAPGEGSGRRDRAGDEAREPV
jgi:IclR family KDG regulon transcriptional repressor